MNESLEGGRKERKTGRKTVKLKEIKNNREK
jgi:hypothetical protein